MFAHYDKNNFDGLGIKCHRQKCDYDLTFGGLLKHAISVTNHMAACPDCCPSLDLEALINELRKTIAEGM